jgi:UDP-3-O-[3-hydroxymyristoyl] glucosamine N-acyltransferase
MIGDQVDVGVASVVIRSVAPGTRVFGYPARTARAAMQQIASLNRLPALMKTVAGLLTRLGRVEQRLDRLERTPPPAPRLGGT